MIRTCPSCGVENQGDAIYCWKCGAQLSLAKIGDEILWYPPTELRAPRPIWSIIAVSSSAILLVASVIAAFTYYPSRSLFLYLIASFVKSEVTRMVLGTVATLMLSAGIFLAAALMYFGFRIVGSILAFIFAVASIITGGGFIAGLVLGMIGALLAVFEK